MLLEALPPGGPGLGSEFCANSLLQEQKCF